MAKPEGPVPSFGQVTLYRSVKFKSKCEARWAALFDQVKGGVTLENWKDHPDALKARRNCLHLLKEGCKTVCIGDGNGRLYIPRKIGESFYNYRQLTIESVDDFDHDWAWCSDWVLSGQSRYDWDRTLVMVTGQNLL
jgi:hypothetical protein